MASRKRGYPAGVDNIVSSKGKASLSCSRANKIRNKKRDRSIPVRQEMLFAKFCFMVPIPKRESCFLKVVFIAVSPGASMIPQRNRKRITPDAA